MVPDLPETLSNIKVGGVRLHVQHLHESETSRRLSDVSVPALPEVVTDEHSRNMVFLDPYLSVRQLVLVICPPMLLRGDEELQSQDKSASADFFSKCLKVSIDVTMAVSNEFHNAPRLYGDPTVRENKKVTGIQRERLGRSSATDSMTALPGSWHNRFKVLLKKVLLDLQKALFRDLWESSSSWVLQLSTWLAIR